MGRSVDIHWAEFRELCAVYQIQRPWRGHCCLNQLNYRLNWENSGRVLRSFGRCANLTILNCPCARLCSSWPGTFQTWDIISMPWVYWKGPSQSWWASWKSICCIWKCQSAFTKNWSNLICRKSSNTWIVFLAKIGSDFCFKFRVSFSNNMIQDTITS